MQTGGDWAILPPKKWRCKVSTTVVFMQVSHKLTAPHNPALEYYKQVYAKCRGYHMPEHFMEIPTWIAVISGMLPSDRYEKVLHVVTDVSETVEWANLLPHGAIIMMSVMDVNRKIVHALLQQVRRKFVLGGYVDPAQFEQYHKAVWLDSVYDVHHAMPTSVEQHGDPDYSLFNRMSVIPRLKLSEGCLFNCAFCTIERKITMVEWPDVLSQLRALRQLNFELVYLDDKTFGQADNWAWLKPISKRIKAFNPQFRGFIVQTTVPMMLKHFEEWVYEQDVAYIEVGVEHVDADYLGRMRKPYNLKNLMNLCREVRRFNRRGTDVEVGFIPNIMFALPDADYTSTIEWVERNVDIITFVNPFILCQYESSKGSLVEEAEGAHDRDENAMVKSWLTDDEVYTSGLAMSTIMNLTR